MILPRRIETHAMVAAVAVLLLFAGWTHGLFDRQLYPLHLNYNECATNVFGAKFCGDDLTEYKQQIARLSRP